MSQAGSSREHAPMLAGLLQKIHNVDEVITSWTTVFCTHANRLLSSLVGLEALTRHLSYAQACGRPPGFRSSGGVRLSCRPSPLLKGQRAWLHRHPVVDGTVVVVAVVAAQIRRSRLRSSLQAHRARSLAPLWQGEWPRVQHLHHRTFECVSGSL